MAQQGSRYKSAIATIQDRPLLLYDTERLDLAALYYRLGYKVGAEIGVGGGIFSEQICQANPDVKLYCIDAWEPYKGYTDYGDPAYLEKDYQDAIKRLTPYHAIIIRRFSWDALSMFSDRSLDFVYIDANHDNPYVGMDIREWSKKVRRGGMVSGHDYMATHKDVVTEVDAQCQRPLFLTGRMGESGNPGYICSWFWVVP